MELSLWSVIQILIAAFLLLAAPVLIGNAVCAILSRKGGSVEKSFAKSFVYGTVAMWALCELVAVPLILLKADFLILVLFVLIPDIIKPPYVVDNTELKKLANCSPVDSPGEPLPSGAG